VTFLEEVRSCCRQNRLICLHKFLVFIEDFRIDFKVENRKESVRRKEAVVQ
jgi:hypothetical protein